MPRADSEKAEGAISPVPATPKPPDANENRASESGEGVAESPKPAAPVVRYDPNDQKGNLKRAAGSNCDGWNDLVINQAINALRLARLPTEQGAQFNATVGALVGIDPKDELEGMIAAQLLAAHHAAMECYRRAIRPGEQSLEVWKETLNQANKLSRTYTMLLESLNRHRGKGQQKMTVEHVHVYEGGQAIVGQVGAEAGGGFAPKSKDQPHALAHAPGAEVPCQIEAEREAMPVAGSEG
jgi:hypothetical protein